MELSRWILIPVKDESFFAKKQGLCPFNYQLGTGTCIRIRIIVIRIVQTERRSRTSEDKQPIIIILFESLSKHP